jgi:hypothetical protein
MMMRALVEFRNWRPSISPLIWKSSFIALGDLGDTPEVSEIRKL